MEIWQIISTHRLLWQVLASKRVKDFFHFSPQKKEKSKEAEYFIYGFSFLITERQKRSGKNVILKQRTISTGLPSRTFGGRLIFQGCFLTTELPRSLHWPLSPYLAAQLSEMFVGMKSRREWRGRRASVRMTSHHLSLPVEGFSSIGSRNCPPTQSYCSQEYEPDTWGHISLKKGRGIWCICSSSERA